MHQMTLFFKLYIYLFYFYFSFQWVFVAAGGFSLVAEDKGYSLVVVCGLLIAVVSLVVKHKL